MNYSRVQGFANRPTREAAASVPNAMLLAARSLQPAGQFRQRQTNALIAAEEGRQPLRRVTAKYVPEGRLATHDCAPVDSVQRQLPGCGSHTNAPVLQAAQQSATAYGCYSLHGPARLLKVGPGLLRAELKPGSWIEVMGAPQAPYAVLLPEALSPDAPASLPHPPAGGVATAFCLLAGEHLELHGPFAVGRVTSSGSLDGDGNGDGVEPLGVADALHVPSDPSQAMSPVQATQDALPVQAMWDEVALPFEGMDLLEELPMAAAAVDVSVGCSTVVSGSYSDALEVCPGLMHHNGSVLVSVHALPQDGLCIELGSGSVMSHPLNMCPCDVSEH